jgi:hypothetical protein
MTRKQDLIDTLAGLRTKRAQEQEEVRTRMGVIQSEIERLNSMVIAWVDGVDEAITAKLVEVYLEGAGLDDLTFVQGVEFGIMGAKATLNPKVENGEVVFHSKGLGEPFIVFKQQQTYLAQDEYERKVFNEDYLYERLKMALPTS